MKKFILLLAVLGFAAAAFWMNQHEAAQHIHNLAAQRAVWETEKAELQAALERLRVPVIAPSIVSAKSVPLPTKPNPQEILEQLVTLRIIASQPRTARPVISLLDQLLAVGPEALPAIKQFLASGRDVAYEVANNKNSHDLAALTSALVPASLRFGLFDVIRQIGGGEAEAMLAEVLGQTIRAVEIAYLTNLLEEISPGKYREIALVAAKNLLPQSISSAERDYLFGVLKRFGDDSYLATAQAQLIQPDGKVDRSALKYVQQTLGEKSVGYAAQLYHDGRVTDPDGKEPLARVALSYVGASDEAIGLFHEAILDPALKPDQHRELVEDLNQDGLSNKKSPTADDLKIIANRYALTQLYLQQDYVQNDKVLNAAFHEADKDLANMLKRAEANGAK